MVKVQGCDRLVLLQSIGHLNDTRDTESAATQVEILDAIVDSKSWSKDLGTLLSEWAKTQRDVANLALTHRVFANHVGKSLHVSPLEFSALQIDIKRIHGYPLKDKRPWLGLNLLQNLLEVIRHSSDVGVSDVQERKLAVYVSDKLFLRHLAC
jgi:hypothetical protein